MPLTEEEKANLKAIPEAEDFGHKYTEEGQGKIGSKLIDNYFTAVNDLVQGSGLLQNESVSAIEIGCGEGHSTKRLRGLLPPNVILQASEYVEDLLPRARKNNPNVEVFGESVYETTHADSSFDLIFLLEVLEHLDYPDKALEELHRILKPGGFLVMGVPREPLWRTLNMARGSYLRDLGNTPGHLNHWSTRGIIKFTSKHFGPVLSSRTPLPWTLVAAQKAGTTP